MRVGDDHRVTDHVAGQQRRAVRIHRRLAECDRADAAVLIRAAIAIRRANAIAVYRARRAALVGRRAGSPDRNAINGRAAGLQRNGEAALARLQDVGAPARVAQAEYTLGLIARARGEGEVSAQHLTAAVTLWRNSNHAGHLTLGLSALAEWWTAHAARERARMALEEALALLAHAPIPDGVVHPLRAHLHCYRALRALEDPRAVNVLTRARTLLQAQAARLPEAQAATFLTAIPEHRALQAGFLENKPPE